MAFHSKIREETELLREQKEFLKNEVNNNKEIELQISLANRNSIKLRDEYNKLLNTLNELTSEVSIFSKVKFNHYLFKFCNVSLWWYVLLYCF